MASKTNLDTLYLVNDKNRKIKLNITVGDEGQSSMLTVRLNKTVLIENHEGDLIDYEIGNNNELNGKKLKIVATISDTSRTTNLTFLNIKINGGVLTRNYPLYKTVENEGDAADYYCNIEFYKP